MYYLDPTNSVIFKELFDKEANKDLLINFLNSILERKEDKLISDVDFDYPFPYNQYPDYIKITMLDIRCVDKTGKKYAVQMQVDLQSDVPEQHGHYNPWDFSFELKKSDPDEKELPVIFICITDYTMFPDNDRYLSHHQIIDGTDNVCRLHHTEYHFLELKKFKKTVEQLDNMTDKWIYFLRHAGECEIIPQQFEQTPLLVKAFSLVDPDNLYFSGLALYEKYDKARRIQDRQLEEAYNDDNKERAAKKLYYEYFSTDLIYKITGLNEKEVKEL